MVFVPLASRLGLGSVLGYLVAGCVIGPWGLRLVRDVEAILHFAEFGVVLMLFLIGLELEPARCGACAARCSAAARPDGESRRACWRSAAWRSGLPWQAALVAGLALALSSTAIAVQTMRERGFLASPTGEAAFGVLLFQDIAAIPLIALVPLLAAGPQELGQRAWLRRWRGSRWRSVWWCLVGRYLTRPLHAHHRRARGCARSSPASRCCWWSASRCS